MILAASAPGMDTWSLVVNAGPMAKFVLLVLAVFSIVSWGITAERFIRFRRAEEQSRVFLERFNQGGGLAAIQDDTADLEWSPGTSSTQPRLNFTSNPGERGSSIRRNRPSRNSGSPFITHAS